MGKYYNQGWSVADTNRLAFIIRTGTVERLPLDKRTLLIFATWVQMNRTYRTVKLMSGFPYARKYMDEIVEFEQKYPDLRDFNINELDDDEWDFICDLPVKEN